MKLRIQEYIETHENWEEELKNAPYCLEIKRDTVFGRDLILFKYNQIESDFSQDIVKESRGLVLEDKSFAPVVFPFVKFFNHSEPYADEIDWSTASVQTKIDGSIIKIVKMDEEHLLIGTNSNIDASKCPFAEQVGCKAKTWGDLILEGLSHYGLTESGLAKMLNYDKTYIFELTSPFNQVVVRWTETKLNFIGVRDNITFKEEKYEKHPLSKVFDTPKIYPLKNLQECLEETSKMGDDEEGYVVRDDNFHRIKVKSPRYLELHRLAGNGILSIERGIDVVKKGETMEMIAYFPHFKDSLEEIKRRYDEFVSRLETSWDGFMTLVTPLAPRKEAAIWIQKNFDIPGVGFALLDGKVRNVREWLEKCPSKNLVKHLGFKD